MCRVCSISLHKTLQPCALLLKACVPQMLRVVFFKTNILYTFFTFLFYIHQFHVFSSFCFFCLARCSFRLFPNFRWDALWGIYSDLTLPYLGLAKRHICQLARLCICTLEYARPTPPNKIVCTLQMYTANVYCNIVHCNIVHCKCTLQMYTANVHCNCTPQMYTAKVQCKCTLQMGTANGHCKNILQIYTANVHCKCTTQM